MEQPRSSAPQNAQGSRGCYFASASPFSICTTSCSRPSCLASPRLCLGDDRNLIASFLPCVLVRRWWSAAGTARASGHVRSSVSGGFALFSSSFLAVTLQALDPASRTTLRARRTAGGCRGGKMSLFPSPYSSFSVVDPRSSQGPTLCGAAYI